MGLFLSYRHTQSGFTSVPNCERVGIMTWESLFSNFLFGRLSSLSVVSLGLGTVTGKDHAIVNLKANYDILIFLALI